MKRYSLMIITVFIITFLVGCTITAPIIEDSHKTSQEKEIIDGYVLKNINNFEYQIPSSYKDVKVDAPVNISEKNFSISSDDGMIDTKAVIVTGVSSVDSYRNSNQFLYDLSQYIDSNKNEMFTYAEKKINGIPWIIGDNYIDLNTDNDFVVRDQVTAAFYKDDQYYYGILFAFPNQYAGKSNDYEYPEFKDEVGNVFSSLIIN